MFFDVVNKSIKISFGFIAVPSIKLLQQIFKVYNIAQFHSKENNDVNVFSVLVAAAKSQSNTPNKLSIF